MLISNGLKNSQVENKVTSYPRILILGAGGFVGSYLRKELASFFSADTKITATSRNPPTSKGLESLDICDLASVRAVIRRDNPTHVVNLVGIAAPVTARRYPDIAWDVHAKAPEQLGRLLLEEAPDCWLLHVGSGLVYGRTALSGRAMDEACPLSPTDPYGVTKAAGDLAIGALTCDGLKCLRLRPFNHTGPGQTEDFVVPAFAAQIARIKLGVIPPTIHVGELSAIRDFLDVRDVATAYTKLIAQTDQLIPGSIFNIASNRGISVEEILNQLIEISGVQVEIKPDPERQRRNDIPKIVGSAVALNNATGWKPMRDLRETLNDTFEGFYQTRIN